MVLNFFGVGVVKQKGKYCYWDVVWELVSRHCPEASRSVNENKFYELMDKVVTSEVLVGGDLSGNVDSYMGGFGEVHGVFGIG